MTCNDRNEGAVAKANGWKGGVRARLDDEVSGGVFDPSSAPGFCGLPWAPCVTRFTFVSDFHADVRGLHYVICFMSSYVGYHSEAQISYTR